MRIVVMSSKISPGAGGSPEGGEADLAAQGVSKRPVTDKVLKHNYISPQLWLMMQSATRGEQFVCSRCQSVLCYRLIS